MNYSRECFDQSCVNRTETVHGTLRSLYLSHLLYGVEGDRGAGARENRGREGYGRREKKGREAGSL